MKVRREYPDDYSVWKAYDHGNQFSVILGFAKQNRHKSLVGTLLLREKRNSR